MQHTYDAFENQIPASTSSAVTLEPVRKNPPNKVGAKWNKAEEMEMLNLFLKGATLEDIAAKHQRTPLAISRRFLMQSPIIAKFVANQQETIKDLTEQLERKQSVVKHLLKELDAKSAPMIGNSA